MLASYDGDQVDLWDVPSGKNVGHFPLGFSGLPGDDANYVDNISISNDKTTLAVGEFTHTWVVGLISLKSGKVVDRFECGPRLRICTLVKFAPQGDMLATTTAANTRDDRTVEPLLRFWKLTDYAKLK